MTKRKMPPQNPSESEQNVGTPWRFVHAVHRLLCIPSFAVDLASSDELSKGIVCVTEQEDTFKTDWAAFTNWQRWGFLNPPFGNIEPFAKKAWEDSRRGACLVMLVPAAVGSTWWHEWVSGKGYTIILRNRMAFIGHTQSYPKDLALIVYAPFLAGGMRYWSWIADEPKKEKTRGRQAATKL